MFGAHRFEAELEYDEPIIIDYVAPTPAPKNNIVKLFGERHEYRVDDEWIEFATLCKNQGGAERVEKSTPVSRKIGSIRGPSKMMCVGDITGLAYNVSEIVAHQNNRPAFDMLLYESGGDINAAKYKEYYVEKMIRNIDGHPGMLSAAQLRHIYNMCGGSSKNYDYLFVGRMNLIKPSPNVRLQSAAQLKSAIMGIYLSIVLHNKCAVVTMPAVLTHSVVAAIFIAKKYRKIEFHRAMGRLYMMSPEPMSMHKREIKKLLAALHDDDDDSILTTYVPLERIAIKGKEYIATQKMLVELYSSE
jgi:hypothetical protein